MWWNTLIIWPTFRTPIRPFAQLWASRVIPGSITICSNRGKIFVSRPTLGTWGTMMAILGVRSKIDHPCSSLSQPETDRLEWSPRPNWQRLVAFREIQKTASQEVRNVGSQDANVGRLPPPGGGHAGRRSRRPAVPPPGGAPKLAAAPGLHVEVRESGTAVPA